MPGADIQSILQLRIIRGVSAPRYDWAILPLRRRKTSVDTDCWVCGGTGNRGRIMQQIIKHIIEVVGKDFATAYIDSLLISERDKNRLYNQLHNSTGTYHM